MSEALNSKLSTMHATCIQLGNLCSSSSQDWGVSIPFRGVPVLLPLPFCSTQLRGIADVLALGTVVKFDSESSSHVSPPL